MNAREAIEEILMGAERFKNDRPRIDHQHG